MRTNRIDLIDGFRGIAIFSVLAYHGNFVINDIHLFSGGYLGVDIFFIISGYINSYILINDLKKNISITDFYIRRIKRLLPLFLIVILTTFFFFWIINKDNLFLNELNNSIIASFLFVSNYYFHYEGLGYAMDIGKVKPLLHTWSLSVEFQFLFIFPIILFLLFRFFEKFKYLFAFLLIVISIYLTNKISLNNPSFNFYFTITRIWEFFLGFYIYILKEKYNEHYDSAVTNTLQIICFNFFFLKTQLLIRLFKPCH
jgi:peptidoglycan/LPS O-acetylase OafA/YrhL